MLDDVVEYSNQYSAQKSGHVANLSRKELEQVIGMFYRMSLLQMAGVRAYWENETNHEPVSGVMSRNRFQYLLTVLHFVDNLAMTDEDKKADKLWKIRPWLNMMRENCLKVVAHEHNSIDEMMVQYKGKTASIRQYVANKPHPWGFKIWIFADNLFTGVPLLVKIKELGMHYVGTVCKNRISGCRHEDEKKLRKEGKGAYDHCVEDSHNIIAVRWLDNKAVTLLSTYTGIEPTDTVRRWDSAVKDHREVERPAIIKAYNKFMGGIDLMDSYLFWHTLMMAIVNAWLVYRCEYKLLQLQERSMMKRQVFQSHVASALVGRMVARPRGRPSLEDVRDVIVKPQPGKVRKGPVDDVRKDAYAHWPVKVQKRGRCKLCAVNNTNTLCEKCNVRLCFVEERNCFKSYYV
ncbi:piggyBac transposable element-derived protein 3-like [Acanthaster planci]|uniref:PiggyBac transposable element-derived protein 3-like n=1 Tax=Acanthaster planci TaxID=133434 RepID=A0A8B7ZAN7_ACAPL|nr:piggyBac transposable element-derived protein 3-like [Acanthaster planci]